MKKGCINQEMLIDYLEGRLIGRKHEKVQRHLSECDICLDSFAFMKEITGDKLYEQTEPVPADVTNRTIKNVLALKDEIGVGKAFGSLKTKGVDLMDALSDIFRPAPFEPVCVRRKADGEEEKHVTIRKNFDGLLVDIEILEKGEAKADIRVELSEDVHQTGPARVTLFEEDREISSFILKGVTVFEDIEFGNYVLVFTKETSVLGEYRFRMIGK